MKKFELIGVKMESEVSVIPTNPRMVIACVEAKHSLDEIAEVTRHYEENEQACLNAHYINKLAATAAVFVDAMYETFRDED